MRTRSEKLESLAENLRNQHQDLRVDNAFHFLRISRILDDYLNVEFRKTGLNRTQVIILHFLLANGGTMTPTEAKYIAFRSNNAISKSLDSLDKRGLTRSSRSKKDRRQRKVTLTEKGLADPKEIQQTVTNRFQEIGYTIIKDEKKSHDVVVKVKCEERKTRLGPSTYGGDADSLHAPLPGWTGPACFRP